MSAVYGADGKSRRVLVPSVKVEPLAQGDEGNWKKVLKAINALIEQGVRSAPNMPLGYAEFEDVEVDGRPGIPATVYLRHGFGSRVRWWVDGVRSYRAREETQTQSWVNRELCMGTWTLVAGNISTGCRFRLKRKREIVGVRFAWASVGSAVNVVARIYNDSTGAVLASSTVSVNNTGVYVAMFASPLTTDLTGVDIVVSTYNSANYVYNTDVTLATATFDWGPDLTQKHAALFFAGDTRPVTPTVGGSYMMEPVFGRSGPMFEEHTDTDENMLVLSAHDAGKFTFRVTPAGT